MSGKKLIHHIPVLLITLIISCSLFGTPKEEKIKSPQQENDAADIYLNFQDASLKSVVDYLAEQRKLNIIPHKDIEGKKVSLSTREPFTLERAWNVLLTLLEMNGFTIINVDDVYRIVPSKEHTKEPLPLYTSRGGTMPKDLPDNDLVVRYIYTLQNIKTDVSQKILNDLLGQNKVQSNDDLGVLIITDKCLNIKAAMKIIEELDTGGLRESIQIIRLQYTNSEDVAKLFSDQIMEQKQQKTIRIIGPRQKKELAFFSSSTKIIPESRQNSLILLGQEKNITELIKFITKYIDVPMEEAQSRIHIKEIKYVSAKEIKKIISDVIKPPQGTGVKTAIVGQFKFFEDIIIEAEDAQVGSDSRGSGNRLIISCGNDDWKRLERFIDKLDKPQPQVAMEIMIVDSNIDDQKSLGAQIREKTGKSLGKGVQFFTHNMSGLKLEQGSEEAVECNPNLINLASTGDDQNPVPGETSITVGKPNDIWAVIKSFIYDKRANIISQPFLITNNNKPSTLDIRTTRRVQNDLSESGRFGKQGYGDAAAPITVKITPRINVEGLVDLDIDIVLEEFIGTSNNRDTRSLNTRTRIATGEVLVLGGLTKNKVTEEIRKTPVLGDIPILGQLFKSKSKKTFRTNLYIFIRPSIIKPKFEGGPDEYTQLKLDYAKYQILNVEDLRNSKDPIQRWFFKPENQSVKQTLSDLAKGVYPPIDDYTQGKNRPKMVNIRRDPYFRPEETIRKVEKKEEAKAVKKEQFEQHKEIKKKVK